MRFAWLLLFSSLASPSSAFYSNGTHGDVVVVMSRGRSGSSWLCEVVKGTDELNKAKIMLELFGGDNKQMEKVKNPLQTMTAYLAEERRLNPKGYIGFKWKLLDLKGDYGGHDKFAAALHYLVQQRVPILYMYRNYLDRVISSYKYEEAKYDDKYLSHCDPKDTMCITEHKNAKYDVDIKHLLRSLEKYDKLHVETVQRLAREKAVHMTFSYDDLAFGDADTKLAILQRILDLMYPGGNKVASLEMLQTKFAVTSDRDQSSRVKNYGEVIAAVEGTRYAGLLRGTAGNGTVLGSI